MLFFVRVAFVRCRHLLVFVLPTPSGGWFGHSIQGVDWAGSCMSRNQQAYISSAKFGLGQVVHSGSCVFWPLAPSGVHLVCKIGRKAGGL